MQKTVETLRTLAESARQIISGGDRRDWEYLETELVRAEDHLEELERYSWDAKVFVIACQPEWNKIYDGRFFYDEEHAIKACHGINKRGETGNFWKVYPALINIKKEALIPMPIYEYECVKCKKRREVLHKSKPDTDTVPCDMCEGTMERIISVPGEPIVHGFNAKNRYSHVKDKKKKED